jgi:hypothetical protein
VEEVRVLAVAISSLWPDMFGLHLSENVHGHHYRGLDKIDQRAGVVEAGALTGASTATYRP